MSALGVEAELEAELRQLGRPVLDTSSIHSIGPSLEAARAWDAAHPVEAARHRALVEALHEAALEREAAEAEAMRASRALRRLESAGVGARSLEAASAALDTEAMRATRDWLESGATWLVLCGARGTGKTVAATWAVREAVRTGGTAAFRRASELAKLSMFDEGAKEMTRLRGVGLLVLDDYGAEVASDYARAQLHELLDARHEDFGRTVLTSNLAWRGVAERMGERLTDRLQQSGRVVELRVRASMRGGAT